MSCSLATMLLAAAFGPIAVTNHAGRVLSGELQDAGNGTFTMNGRRLPLSILPPSEQTRVLRQARQDVRTAAERRIDADLSYELRRIEARLAECEIDDVTAARLREDARNNAASRRAAAGEGVRRQVPRKTVRR